MDVLFKSRNEDERNVIEIRQDGAQNDEPNVMATKRTFPQERVFRALVGDEASENVSNWR